MRIAVVGTGYEGLVVGTGFAENGHNVCCVDRRHDLIERLSKGEAPNYEPGLEELVLRNMEEGRLRFTTDLAEAVTDSLLIFICVGTAATETGGHHTEDVMSAAEQIGHALRGYRIIVIMSTCPVGTADKVREAIAAATTEDFDVVVNPSFLKEGAAIDDFMRPDRVVIGCDDVRVEEILKELYVPFLRTGKPFLSMSLRSAELTKFAANSMLAARISLINELSALCELYGADISQVREGIAADERIGPAYLFAGLGFGGSGLPKDLSTCDSMARAKGLDVGMFRAIIEVNDRQLERFIQRIRDHFDGQLAGKRVAIWGTSFKPRTDDLRGAPALRIIDALLADGASVVAFDPVAGPKLRDIYGDRITVSAKNYDALEGADALVVATEWREFQRPDYERMVELMREPVIFDGRNTYTPEVLARHGFTYYSIGRPRAD